MVGVMPDLLHVVPVGDDAVLDGVLEGEDSSLGLSLVPDVGVFLAHTHHHTLMPGASHDGREHGSRSIVSSKPSFAHTGSIVHDKSGYLVVTHDACLVAEFFKPKSQKKKKLVRCLMTTAAFSKVPM